MQVPKPYVPNSITDVTKTSKEEANQVGEALDQMSKQVKNPILKESMLKYGSILKFGGNSGTYNQSYLNDQTKQYGIVRDAWNKVTSALGFNQKPDKTDVKGLQSWGDDQYSKSKPTPSQSGTQPIPQNNPQPTQQSQPVDQKGGRYKKSSQRTVQRTQANPNPPANPQPVTPNPPQSSNKISHDKIDDALNLHRDLAIQYVNNPIGTFDTKSMFQSGDVEGALAENLSTANNFDQLRVANKNGKVDRGATAYLQNSIQDQSANAANKWYMDPNTGQVNDNWRYAANQAYVNATPMQRNNYQFLSQLARTYSNNKMVKLDNIKFFSDSSKEIIVKMYADQLSEEEIQNALKWKNRKKKLLNILKTIGGIGLAGAALYGGSKWYQNGGKEFLSKVGDNASDFVSKTGDAAVDAGKGIADASKDELNRLGDAAARAQLEKSDNDAVSDTDTDGQGSTEAKNEVAPSNDSDDNLSDRESEVEHYDRQFEGQIDDLSSKIEATKIKIQGFQDMVDKYTGGTEADEDHRKVAENQLELLSHELSELESARDKVYESSGRLHQAQRKYSIPQFVRASQTRMFDQPAVQLSEEEIAKATAAKQRRMATVNALKKLGWSAAAIAALYGGAKWYQNGGKGFVENVADQGANFAGTVGDAAVNAGKGIAGAASNEANRNLDNWATNRVGGTVPNAIANGAGIIPNPVQSVTPPTQQPAVTAEPEATAPTVTSTPAQPVVDGATGATIPSATDAAQVNANAQSLVDGVTGATIPDPQPVIQTTPEDLNAQANAQVNDLIQIPDSEVDETEEPE